MYWKNKDSTNNNIQKMLFWYYLLSYYIVHMHIILYTWLYSAVQAGNSNL